MRKIYFLFLLLFISGGIFGQTNIANYLFSTSTGTYTPISGGTVVASGTYDNQVSGAVALGGTFTYGGVAFTTCFVSANGYITFGAAPAGTNYTPMSTLGATTGAISAFGQDAGGSEVAGATPEVSYLNIGGATGEFVVQYKDHANYYNRTVERLNFQIRLNLASGVINIVYGPCTNPGSVSTVNGVNVHVGIRGNSTTYASNVNNLMVGDIPVGTTCSWANAVTGNANNSTMLFSSTNVNVNIPNGLTYTWLPLTAVAPVRTFAAVSAITTTGATLAWTAPTGAAQYNVQYRVPGTCAWTNYSGNPVAATTAILTGLVPSTTYQVRVQAINGANSTIYSHIPNAAGSGNGYTTTGTFTTLDPPCTNPVTAGVTASTSVTVCPSASFTLSVTGATVATGLTYVWESSSDGVIWNPVTPAATGATLVTSQTTATYYRRKITCSGVDAWSTSLQVTMNSFINCYCNTGLTTNINGVDIVTNVKLTNSSGGTFTQASTSNGTNNYVSYNNTPLDLAQGTTSSLAITYGTDGTQYGAAWIDYNQNGVFEASENIALAASSSGGSSTVTYNFTVPLSSLLGNTRIRVRGGSDGAYTAAGACANTAYGETEDYIVNIVAPPPCVTPGNLVVSAITTSSATFTWDASSSAPAGGYQWEVRTSGAAGSGAAGLTASGTTTTAVLTANTAVLAANTDYTVYVRAVCNAGLVYSAWTSGVLFHTLCNTVTTFPFTETFETSSISRPCWNREIVTGTFNWVYGAGAGNGGPVTTAHGGSVNAQYFGNNYNGDKARLVSPRLDLSGMAVNGADLEFWYINPDWAGDINELRVFYRTTDAGAWTLIPGAVYTTNVSAWTKVEITNLPNITGTYYIAFEGTQLFGWGVGIDDVVVKAGPSCRKPTAVSAQAITSTSVSVSFTSPGTAFIVEYGPPGFTPGTGSTAGVGGTLAFGASSPITVSPLTASTAYDFYIRRVCTPGVDYSENVKMTTTTLCAPTNVPYNQNFDAVTVPNLPTCTSLQDLNGGPTWLTYAAPAAWGFPGNSLRYLYDVTLPANDWFFIQGLNLTGGTAYQLSYKYGSTDPLYPERMKVAYGTTASATGMVNVLADYTSIIANPAAPFAKLERLMFTPATTGVYYIGFQAYSAPDQYQLFLDSINVKLLPPVDVGVTTATGFPTCPGNGTIQATIRNYNLTAVNFATFPVTVTASMTGASTGNVSTTINTGSLAPGATMTVNLPAFNFVAGIYNVTVKTASPSDPETANDSYNTITYVNAVPAVATVTPAAPAICAGSTVQLNTQFTTPPPAPVTMPAVSSGTLSVAVPDNDPLTGVTNNLTVAGVPATATITGISVTLNLTTTWNADIIFNLRAPNGKILNLVNRKGGNGDGYTTAIISSAGTTALPTANTTPVTGTFAADASLGVGPAAYASNATSFTELMQGGNGVWTLALTDNALNDFATLTSWSITITYATPHPKVTWTPVTGLFTDATTTTAYTAGTDAYSVYAKPAATTTYTVTTTSAAGCVSTSTVTVTVNPNPVISISALPARICISDSLVALTATPVGGTWTGIGTSGTNFVPPATAVGTYTLSYTYTNTFGCTTTNTTTAKVEECPERIILLRDNAVILYPNPNNGQFNIRINSTLYNKLTMRVYTSTGTLVRTQQFSGLVFGRVVPIDLRAMPGGSYMVQFSYDGGVRTSEKAFKVIIGR